MVERNPRSTKLSKSYLFREVADRVQSYKRKNPGAVLYNLGIGDTTIPLPQVVTQSLSGFFESLSTEEGYLGYQNEQGNELLRKSIIERFYPDTITPDEVFVSDGAKCDIGRLQILLSHLSPVLIQDPTYPVYRDGTLLSGDQSLIYAVCNPENDFFPNFSGSPKLLYICSPNNPTGTVLTYTQLTHLVSYAKEHGALIIFDAAYRYFIQGEQHPRTIYEIPGAKEIAIEVNSFSKFAGFTGIRLGWSIVPKTLKGLYDDYARLHSTIFNGASILAQKCGEVVLQEGFEACMASVEEYRANTKAMRDALLSEGETVYGGEHAPYVWIETKGKSSWEAFQYYLEEKQLIVTPGSGFGKGGEGFVRLSGFFHPSTRSAILDRLACSSYTSTLYS